MTTPYYYPLFEHMAKNHGLTLTDSDMDEICRAVAALPTEESPYVRTWREHWAEICVRSDGSLNLDAIQRELHDYWNILQNVPVVYDRITEGLISKPHTKAEGVLAAYEDAMRRMIDQEIKESMASTTPAPEVKP